MGMKMDSMRRACGRRLVDLNNGAYFSETNGYLDEDLLTPYTVG